MNLETALQELLKRPKSMIGKDGKAVPALRYSERLYYAIKWLVKRYNDGTLQVIGYDKEDAATRGKLQRHSIRRGHELDMQGYMQKSEFIRQTGFSIKTVNRISRLSESSVKVGRHVYININKYFYYLDNIAKEQHETDWLNLGQAVKLTNLPKGTIKDLISKGKVKVDKTALKSRAYHIDKQSLIECVAKMKGELDGEISNNDSKVH